MENIFEIDDDIKTDESTQERPGHLKNISVIVIHTAPAQKLFRGAFKSHMGLLPFASKMLAIWQAAKADDPYADLFLLRIENMITETRQRFKKLKEQYEKILESVAGLQAKPLVSEKPLERPLNFAVPQAYMAAYLLVDFDQLVRIILSTKYMSLSIQQNPNLLLKQMKRSMRQVLARPLLWRHTGITRADIKNNNPIAQKAKELMGELHEQILDGTLRAKSAPKIVKIDAL